MTALTSFVRTLRLAPLAALLALGCTPPPPVEEPDAGLAPLPIRVVTWNLRQFGADGGIGERHAPLLASLSADLVTVQEVSTAPALEDLTGRLEGYSSALGPLAASSGELRQAFLWRAARLTVRDVVPLFEDQPLLFPRPPLQATVDLPDGRASFTVIAVHLKAGARAADEDKRVEALKLLEATARALTGASAGPVQVLLLGDFNEAPSDPRYAEAFAPFTGAPERYRLLTGGFADAGVVTFLPRPLLFDHLVATSALDGARDGGLPSVPRLDQQDPNYLRDVSDHLPVQLDLTF